MKYLRLWRHDPIRTSDETGRIATAGYCWDEFSLWDRLGMFWIAACAIVFVAIHTWQHTSYYPVLAAIGCAIGLCLSIVTDPRIVVFASNGLVLTPNGLPRTIWPYRSLAFPHHEIASIEVTSDCEKFGVMIFSVEGSSVLVTQRLKKAEARRVAVQLTKALAELRESMAASRMQGAQVRRSALVD